MRNGEPRYIRRLSDINPVAYADVRSHRVEPRAAGYFLVTSGTSGKVYRVNTDGECECPGYRGRMRCSHLDAVLVFAADVLKQRA